MFRSSWSYWRRIPTRNSRPLDRRPPLMIESALDPPYPTAFPPRHQHCLSNNFTTNQPTYLHGDQPIVHQYFLCQKVRPNRRLVASTELFVDLNDTQPSESIVCMGVNVIMMHQVRPSGLDMRCWTYILIHQTCLAHATVAKYDDLFPRKSQSVKCIGILHCSKPTPYLQ